MTTEEKFKAAVNVIRSLPKNGSYQPSNELMLRFYGLFKQATNGPCNGKRPAFYDLVNRAKYDAWKKLGLLSKKEAMALYVKELHSIVETMSYSENVANFLEAPSNELESVSVQDLELIAGDVIEKINSHSNSPFRTKNNVESVEQLDSQDSEDEFIDTIDFSEMHLKNNFQNVSQEISETVQILRSDLESLTKRVEKVEKNKKTALSKKYSRTNNHLLLFMVLWPFLASFITYRFLSNKKHY